MSTRAAELLDRVAAMITLLVVGGVLFCFGYLIVQIESKCETDCLEQYGEASESRYTLECVCIDPDGTIKMPRKLEDLD